MNFVIDNAQKMTTLSAEQMEESWHKWKAVKAAGIHMSMDHFGVEMSAANTIVYPATAIIILRSYKQSSDIDELFEIKSYLFENLDHLINISK